MKFRSNNSVAVELPDLRKAETFYSGVMNFRLIDKTATHLEYDTGRFVLHINKAAVTRPPMPRFSVINTREAKQHLEQNGCEIITDHGDSLHFKDPFGLVYDLVQD